MTINDIMTMISTIGFPCVVCLLCFWYINKKDEQHREEMKSVTDAINNNTLMMQRVLDKIGDDTDD